MKKGSFIGLLYREYYLGRHSYFTGFISFVGFALIGLLAVLSMKHGNFALLFGDAAVGSTGIFKNKETADIVQLIILTGIKYMPPVMTVVIGFTAADVSAKDTLTTWNRFEHCSPVTPMRYAAVKLTSTALGTAVSLILSLIYMLIITLVMDEKFTYGDFSVIVLFITIFLVFGIISQIFITLFGSNDKGMMASVGVFMLCAFIFSGINAANDSKLSNEMSGSIDSYIAKFTNIARNYCPVMLAVMIASFAVLFISMYLLYKRREK